MNLKRTTTMVVVGGALIAWLAGAATSNHPVLDVPAAQQTTIEKRGAELAIEIERLHERLSPAAAPRTPSRNLFSFHAAAVRQPAAPVAPAPRAALSETAAPVAVLPPLKLSGIAEDAGPDGPVRMAFIAGGGDLFMVKEGDAVTARYRVAKIAADVVELTDLVDNSVRRLALR